MKIVRRSEIVMKDLADLRQRAARVWEYEPDLAISANLANPTVHALEETLTRLEGGHRSVAVGTGQAAIVTAILSTVKSGERLLLPDSVYGPVRLLADNQLKALGIGVDYYTDDLEAKITPQTKLIYLESPGSLTFEVQDLAAVAAIAREHDILTAIDNTWSTPLCCQPLRHGIDMVIHSLSKLAAGNGEIFGGAVVVSTPELYKAVKDTAVFLGHWLSPDDAAAIAAGLETLPQRLAVQADIARRMAERVAAHPKVKQVFAPFLPVSPEHARWQKYHSGHCGLFSFLIDGVVTEGQLDAFFRRLPGFSLSFGWGGPNALAVPVRPTRTVKPAPQGHMIRIYTGLTDRTAELIAALDKLP